MSELLTQLTETAAWVADAKASGVSATDAARAMRRTVAPRLTAAQRAAVRSLMEDEGQTRAEAVAWVLAFGVQS